MKGIWMIDDDDNLKFRILNNDDEDKDFVCLEALLIRFLTAKNNKDFERRKKRGKTHTNTQKRVD